MSVDAYILGTEISKAQTRDIRIASGIQTPLEDVLFTTIEDANQSIESRLNYVLEQSQVSTGIDASIIDTNRIS